MKVSFEAIGEQVVTFYNNATSPAEAGHPVKMSGNGEVCECSAADRFMGVCLECGNEFASVVTGGYVKLGYSGGTAPSVGYCKLEADGDGKVNVDTANGFEYLVIDMDTTDKTVGIML